MKYVITFVFSASFLWFSGCEKKEIPPPPVSHARLVKKLFNNLKEQQYDAAVKRIQKVRALAPTNDFLIQFEELTYCNRQIHEAQKQLDSNDIAASMQTIKKARRKYPLNRNLIEVQEELNRLNAIQKRIKTLNNAVSSREMYSQINAIKKFSHDYPKAKELAPALRIKIKKAFKTNLYEKQRARFDLLCDLEAARHAERFSQSLNDTLSAVLKVDNEATVNKNEWISETLLD